MTFAISLMASRHQKDMVRIKHCGMIVEAFNADEATGIANRLLDYVFPPANWDETHASVSSVVVDPSEPFEKQITTDREVRAGR